MNYEQVRNTVTCREQQSGRAYKQTKDGSAHQAPRDFKRRLAIYEVSGEMSNTEGTGIGTKTSIETLYHLIVEGAKLVRENQALTRHRCTPQ